MMMMMLMMVLFRFSFRVSLVVISLLSWPWCVVCARSGVGLKQFSAPPMQKAACHVEFAAFCYTASMHLK